MIGADEALSIDFVNVFGTRWTRREPTVLGHHLQTADRIAVARCMREDLVNPLASKRRCLDLIRTESAEFRFLFAICGCIRALVNRGAVFAGQSLIQLSR